MYIFTEGRRVEVSETPKPASLGPCKGRARGTQFQAFAEDEDGDEFMSCGNIGEFSKKMAKSLAGQCELTIMKNTTVKIIKLPFSMLHFVSSFFMLFIIFPIGGNIDTGQPPIFCNYFSLLQIKSIVP